jgi:hypothetical protein
MACASVGTSAAQASTPAYTIEAFAGTGTAGPPTPGPATSSDLSGSYQVAVDTAGNVYVIDQGNYEVDKITPSGTLSIIAGTGTQGPPAAGPATSSPLGDPDGLAVDAAGNVYIADQTSAEVLKVTPAGALSIIAGTGTQGMPTPGPATSSDLETPSGLAVDPASDVYVADDGAAEIEKITPSGMLSIVAGTGTSGTPAAGPATSSPLGDPDGVAVDSAGNLFISDALDYVEEVTPAGNLSIFAGNGSSGNPVAGPATSSPLGEPYEISVDPAGDVDVADYNDIEQISPSGTLAIIAGDNTGGPPTYGQPSTSSALYYPPGVAVSPSGIVYIADYFNNTVDQLVPGTPASAVMPTISGSAVIGQTLTASVGSWSNEPTSYAYQWQDCDSSGANCVDIAGATASTYTVSALDLGHTIRVAVTASNGDHHRLRKWREPVRADGADGRDGLTDRRGPAVARVPADRDGLRRGRSAHARVLALRLARAAHRRCDAGRELGDRAVRRGADQRRAQPPGLRHTHPSSNPLPADTGNPSDPSDVDDPQPPHRWPDRDHHAAGLAEHRRAARLLPGRDRHADRVAHRSDAPRYYSRPSPPSRSVPQGRLRV